MKPLNNCKKQSEIRCTKMQWQNVNKQLWRHSLLLSFHSRFLLFNNLSFQSALPCSDPSNMGTQRLKFTTEQLRDAVRAVSSGVSAGSAAKDFGIPWGTLLRRMKCPFPNQCDARPAFTKNEEDTFASGNQIKQWASEVTAVCWRFVIVFLCNGFCSDFCNYSKVSWSVIVCLVIRCICEKYQARKLITCWEVNCRL